MAKYTKFEDLPVWKEAAQLYNRVLDLLEEPSASITPGFRNQLDRAALSVSAIDYCLLAICPFPAEHPRAWLLPKRQKLDSPNFNNRIGLQFSLPRSSTGNMTGTKAAIAPDRAAAWEPIVTKP